MKNKMIKIGNKYHKDIGEYVGRGSPLGNLFVMKDKTDRDRVCDEYEKWFDEHKEDINIKKELDRLYNIYKDKGELTLVCYCSPKRCHAETIKRYLEEREI
jgi:uncharacterized protein YeaO (DUF488 family)